MFPPLSCLPPPNNNFWGSWVPALFEIIGSFFCLYFVSLYCPPFSLLFSNFGIVHKNESETRSTSSFLLRSIFSRVCPPLHPGNYFGGLAELTSSSLCMNQCVRRRRELILNCRLVDDIICRHNVCSQCLETNVCAHVSWLQVCIATYDAAVSHHSVSNNSSFLVDMPSEGHTYSAYTYIPLLESNPCSCYSVFMFHNRFWNVSLSRCNSSFS